MSNADLCWGCGQATISTGGIGCRCGYEPCRDCGAECSFGTLAKPKDKICLHCRCLRMKWPKSFNDKVWYGKKREYAEV